LQDLVVGTARRLQMASAKPGRRARTPENYALYCTRMRVLDDVALSTPSAQTAHDYAWQIRRYLHGGLGGRVETVGYACISRKDSWIELGSTGRTRARVDWPNKTCFEAALGSKDHQMRLTPLN